MKDKQELSPEIIAIMATLRKRAKNLLVENKNIKYYKLHQLNIYLLKLVKGII